MVQSYISIPRLARLTRQLQASPEDTILAQEVVSLARRLYATTIDADFFLEATSLGHLWVEPTKLGAIVDVIPTSYGFKSGKLVALLTMYWMARLLICGLVEKLMSTTPSTQCFDSHEVESEDIGIATEVLMIVQYVFEGLPDADSDTKRIKQLQLLSVLQISFGTWHRMKKRAMSSRQESGEESERKIKWASAMEQLCLDLGNQLLDCMQLPLMTLVDMETMSEMFAGGPLVQCILPES
jgi:hypothetical protein